MLPTEQEMREEWYKDCAENSDIGLWRREIADFWIALIKKRDEVQRKMIQSIGAGRSSVESDDTEYEKGYWGAKEDILGLLPKEE